MSSYRVGGSTSKLGFGSWTNPHPRRRCAGHRSGRRAIAAVAPSRRLARRLRSLTALERADRVPPAAHTSTSPRSRTSAERRASALLRDPEPQRGRGVRHRTEIARGLAGTGVCSGSPHCRARGVVSAVVRCEARQRHDLSTHEIVGIIVGFYYTGAAKWELAREQFTGTPHGRGAG